jgi:hypothetical protein
MAKKASKAQDALARLVEQARRDPQFFHNLVFDPDRVIAKLDYLSRESKAALVALDPARVIGGLARLAKDCGVTCGGSSCEDTCGSVSCNHTCTDSCTNTCKNSCGGTVRLQSLAGRPEVGD